MKDPIRLSFVAVFVMWGVLAQAKLVDAGDAPKAVTTGSQTASLCIDTLIKKLEIRQAEAEATGRRMPSGFASMKWFELCHQVSSREQLKTELKGIAQNSKTTDQERQIIYNLLGADSGSSVAERGDAVDQYHGCMAGCASAGGSSCHGSCRGWLPIGHPILRMLGDSGEQLSPVKSAEVITPESAR
jgi:hypothetical protein